MKLSQLIEYSKRNIFLPELCTNEAGRLAPDLTLFFKNAQYEVKASGLQLNFMHFDSPELWIQLKQTV